MNSLLKNLGLILIVLGSVILIACFVSGNSNDNAILGGSLVAIIAGLIAHIVFNKKFVD